MYLPIPASIKPQAKQTIDTVMDRLGDGTAGVMLLLIMPVFGFGLKVTLVVNMLVIVGWIWIAIGLRRQYLVELRNSMGSGPPRGPAGEPVELDADTLELLRQLLHSGGESQKLAALQWLAARPELAEERTLVELVRGDPSAAVRRSALMLLLGRRESDLPGELLERLQGEGHRVLVQAIDLLTGPPGSETTRHLQALLGRTGEIDRLPLLAFVFRQLGEEFEPFARRCFEALLRDGAPADARKAAARTLGLLPAASSLQDMLHELLDDRDPEVASAAAESAGALGRIDLIPAILPLLARPRARAGARRGLQGLGEAGVGPICEALGDRSLESSVRAGIPDALAEFDSSIAVTALVQAMEDDDLQVRDRAVASLLRLRRRRPEWHPLRGGRLVGRILTACRDHERYRSLLAESVPDPARTHPAAAFLVEVLDAKRRRSAEWIFELLALEYPVEDIRRACWSMDHGTEADRSNAIEYLDNMLPRPLKSRLIPLMDGGASRRATVRARAEFLTELVVDEDPWVRACAWHVARREGVGGLSDQAEPARRSEFGPLRQEAEAWSAWNAAEEDR